MQTLSFLPYEYFLFLLLDYCSCSQHESDKRLIVHTIESINCFFLHRKIVRTYQETHNEFSFYKKKIVRDLLLWMRPNRNSQISCKFLFYGSQNRIFFVIFLLFVRWLVRFEIRILIIEFIVLAKIQTSSFM